ncbi:MAG: hypothetical protein IPL13_04135 [Saprospiraceae bacterium]|nr:hypothetical protein [Candidatus Brachybacter algidus]
MKLKDVVALLIVLSSIAPLLKEISATLIIEEPAGTETEPKLRVLVWL